MNLSYGCFVDDFGAVKLLTSLYSMFQIC